ncbi:hypothetical protein L1068_19940 [Pseudoalteromonas sp. MMG023]|nr:hypothetical protein [Pseudoalteromonas sp. MMG024]
MRGLDKECCNLSHRSNENQMNIKKRAQFFDDFEAENFTEKELNYLEEVIKNKQLEMRLDRLIGESGGDPE